MGASPGRGQAASRGLPGRGQAASRGARVVTETPPARAHGLRPQTGSGESARSFHVGGTREGSRPDAEGPRRRLVRWRLRATDGSLTTHTHPGGSHEILMFFTVHPRTCPLAPRPRCSGFAVHPGQAGPHSEQRPPSISSRPGSPSGPHLRLAIYQGRMSPGLTETEPGPGDTTRAQAGPSRTDDGPCALSRCRWGVTATEANQEVSLWNTCRGEAQTTFQDRGKRAREARPSSRTGPRGPPGPPPNAVSYLWMGIFEYELFLSTSGSAQFFSEAGVTNQAPHFLHAWKRAGDGVFGSGALPHYCNGEK